MGKILFRGKRVNNGEWVYGFPCYTYDRSKSILCITVYGDQEKSATHSHTYAVIPETVGQYTGLTDADGVSVFEGDIVLYPIEQGKHRGSNTHTVVFETRGGSAYFGITMNEIETWQFCMEVPAKLMRVVGNIHDTTKEGAK